VLAQNAERAAKATARKRGAVDWLQRVSAGGKTPSPPQTEDFLPTPRARPSCARLIQESDHVVSGPCVCKIDRFAGDIITRD